MPKTAAEEKLQQDLEEFRMKEERRKMLKKMHTRKQLDKMNKAINLKVIKLVDDEQKKLA